MGDFHQDLTLDNLHAVNARVFADIAARDADTAFHSAATNVNKIVRVDTSPVSYFILVDNVPTWEGFGTSAFDTFLELTDTPSSYVGEANKVVSVNAGGTALEFSTPIITDIVAGPASATNNALARFDGTTGKLLQDSLLVVSDAAAIVLEELNNPTAANVANIVQSKHFLNITTAGLVEASRVETQLTDIGELTAFSTLRHYALRNSVLTAVTEHSFLGHIWRVGAAGGILMQMDSLGDLVIGGGGPSAVDRLLIVGGPGNTNMLSTLQAPTSGNSMWLNQNTAAANIANTNRKSDFLNISVTGLVEASRLETGFSDIGETTNDSFYTISTRLNNVLTERLKLEGDGTINALTSRVINVVDPTANQDAATKKYVDDQILTQDTFLELTDTPSSYSGQANKLININVGETALEFNVATLNAAGELAGLTQLDVGFLRIDDLTFGSLISTQNGVFGPDISLQTGSGSGGTGGDIILDTASGTSADGIIKLGTTFGDIESGSGAATTWRHTGLFGSGSFGGATVPLVAIHAKKASAGAVTPFAETVIIAENNTDAFISLLTPNASISGVLFGDVADNDIGSIKYSHTSDFMQFTVNAAERMRIESTGQLFVDAAVSTVMRIRMDAGSGIESSMQFEDAGGARLRVGYLAGGFVTTPTTNVANIGAGTNGAVVLAPRGNFAGGGITMYTPNAALTDLVLRMTIADLTGQTTITATTDSILNLQRTVGGGVAGYISVGDIGANRGRLGYFGTSGLQSSIVAGQIGWNTNGGVEIATRGNFIGGGIGMSTYNGTTALAEVLRITDGVGGLQGDVGIGTATPEVKLHVHEASAGTIAAVGGVTLCLETNTNNFIQFKQPNASGAGILFGDPAVAVAGAFSYTVDDEFTWSTLTNVVKMRLSAAGNLLVGHPTNVASETLEITSATSLLPARILISDGSTDRLLIGNDSTVAFRTTLGEAQIVMGNVDTHLRIATRANIAADLRFFTAPSASGLVERVRMKGAGDVVFFSGVDFARTATAVSVSTANETIIGVTDTSVARTITIATADIVDGRLFIIKDESGAAGTNNITIATEGAQTIDGLTTAVISVNYGVARMYSNGTNLFTF